MVRLNDNLLQPIPQVLCDSTSVSHLSVALLNVRSIVAKMSDKNLTAFSILLVYTVSVKIRLNASQVSPLVKPDQTAVRCDKMTCEN